MEFSAVYNHPGSTSGNVYNSNLGTANTFSIAAGTLGTVEAYTTWGTTIPSLVGTNSGVVIRVQFDAKDYQNASVNWATESDWCTGTGCNDSSGNGASGVFINGTNERIGSCNSVHYVSQSSVPNPTVIYDFTFEYIVLSTYTSIGFVIGMQFGSSYTLATVN
jgi:hypothetical protein